MTTSKNSMRMGLMIVAFAVLLFPSLSYAATYGYVGTDGYVRSIVANGWQEAINTASQISIHSGVVLFQTVRDFDIVGNFVIGI